MVIEFFVSFVVSRNCAYAPRYFTSYMETGSFDPVEDPVWRGAE
jgi:hypothetical protein